MWVDKILNHDEAKQKVKEHGMEGFVQDLENEYHGDFYGCSLAWLDEPSFICKLKGGKRDLIIGWEGIHDGV